MNTLVRSLFMSSAELGRTTRSPGTPDNVTVANIFGLSAWSAFAKAMRSLSRREVRLDDIGYEQHFSVQYPLGIGRQAHLGVLIFGNCGDVLFRNHCRDPNDAQVGNRHDRLRGVIDERAGCDGKRRHAAAHRCGHGQKPARWFGIGGCTEGLETRLRSQVFGGGLRGVALGLVQILVRGGTELGLLLLPREDFSRRGLKASAALSLSS